MRYTYAVVPVALVREVALVPIEKDAFVSRTAHADKVTALLAQGYRWIRTEGDDAVLELECSDVPAPKCVVDAVQNFRELRNGSRTAQAYQAIPRYVRDELDAIERILTAAVLPKA